MKSPGRPKTLPADFERLTVRLPAEIMKEVRVEAEQEGRPLNTQIQRIIEQWVGSRRGKTKAVAQ